MQLYGQVHLLSYLDRMSCRGGSRTAAASKMERFVLIVNGWKPLTITTKCSILNVAAILDPHLILLLKSSPSCLSFESSETPSEKICVALTFSVWLPYHWSRLIIQNQITIVFYFELCWIFVVCFCSPHKWFIFFVKHYISLRWKIQPFNSICERLLPGGTRPYNKTFTRNK